jgi:hypothetical protein
MVEGGEIARVSGRSRSGSVRFEKRKRKTSTVSISNGPKKDKEGDGKRRGQQGDARWTLFESGRCSSDE